MSPFKFGIKGIDDDGEKLEDEAIEISFKPFHYTIFEDQEMVHVTVARQGGNPEAGVMESV